MRGGQFSEMFSSCKDYLCKVQRSRKLSLLHIQTLSSSTNIACTEFGGGVECVKCKVLFRLHRTAFRKRENNLDTLIDEPFSSCCSVGSPRQSVSPSQNQSLGIHLGSGHWKGDLALFSRVISSHRALELLLTARRRAHFAVAIQCEIFRTSTRCGQTLSSIDWLQQAQMTTAVVVIAARTHEIVAWLVEAVIYLRNFMKNFSA